MMRGVTVVIPAWGRHAELYLEDALLSLAGEVPASSILVVDNASDEPLCLPGVRTVRLDERVTVGRCRTMALRHVDTPYVMFWDADDVILPGTVAALRAELERDRGATVAVAPILDEDGSPHGWPRPRLRWVFRVRSLLVLLHATSSLFPTTGAVLFRTAALRSGGGFGDGDLGEDWVAGLSLALRGRVTFVDVGGRIYRSHADELAQELRAAELDAASREMRARVRSDPAARRLRLLLPLVWSGQRVVALVIRPLRRRLWPRDRDHRSECVVSPVG